MINDINSIFKLRIFNKLKSVYRLNSVDGRKESAAEHSWSSLIIADYFLTKYYPDLDRLKVYELLMYHDVVEIKAGDTPLSPSSDLSGKSEKEKEAASLLGKLIPQPLGEKFARLFEEFEGMKTREARFARAVDALDSMIHELDYKKDWKGWSRRFLIEKKEKFFEEFPPLKKAFYDVLGFLKKNGYII